MLPPTVAWADGRITLVDQTALPTLRLLTVGSVDELVEAIQRLVVRGAPALGAAGALGVALAARTLEGAEFDVAVARLAAARPTAVNLAVGVHRALAAAPHGSDAVLEVALAVVAEDVAACRAIGARGAVLLGELCGPGALRLHTHCNAGALACVEYGTALGVVRALHEVGRIGYVVADETRPLLQGARITAVELVELGIAHRVVVDGAGPSIIARGLIDAVVVGADRIAANGDVANKIGTYPLALAAARAGIPFLVAAPESTVDLATPDGSMIEIEERAAEEVLTVGGIRSAPPASRAWNPAFDVTPADLVTAIVTERRVWRPGCETRCQGGYPPESRQQRGCPMTAARVAGENFELDASSVEQAVAELDPEPIREHYVVIGRRRYPPKQVLAAVTGLDRGDFTTHQARSILRRLGFGVHRKGYVVPPPRDPETSDWPHQGAEAALLKPYMGRYVAQDGLEVLYESDSPYDVMRWLRKNGLRATVWRVPAADEEIGSWTSMSPL